ncbi:hypothetical protein BU15DRAFT_68796 [Melanogaster broomeanus]|nr:hypothetical protein BU15DRAFT_68796 [Melanogaster broomeanus]
MFTCETCLQQFDLKISAGYTSTNALRVHMKRVGSTWVGLEHKPTLVTHAQDIDALCTKNTQSIATTSSGVIDLQIDARLDETMLSPPPASVESNKDMMISPRFNILPDVSMLSPRPTSPPLPAQQPRSLTVR